MFNSFEKVKPEHLAGLFFVLILHGALLFGLWSYQIIPTPNAAITVMVNLINPQPMEQPKLAKPEVQKALKPQPVDPPKPQQLVVETPVTIPEQQVVYAPSLAPVVEAPPLPTPQPVVLTNELSVSCPERSPPAYPRLSMRMNEQGKVVLRVELGDDGRIVNVTIKSSSGYPRLDDAALSAVKTWRCTPTVRNGVAIQAVALQPFNFTLEGR